jgi:hypothetical protein
VTGKASGCEVELSRNRFTNREAFVSHANAALTPRARLKLALLVVEEGWTYTAAAKMFVVSPRTAKKWADRFVPTAWPGWTTAPHTAPQPHQDRCPANVFAALLNSHGPSVCCDVD